MHALSDGSGVAITTNKYLTSSGHDINKRGIVPDVVVEPPSEKDQDAANANKPSPAPKVELEATNIGKALPDKKDAKTLKLSDLKGKKNIVLWFYPKALTGG